uniref:CYTH domain-containing protein n=1 Tax=Chrysemys picta bellii TaxID=8478 RepID=A0A8C3H8J1_CHRPI
MSPSASSPSTSLRCPENCSRSVGQAWCWTDPPAGPLGPVAVLSQALGVQGVVKKERRLYVVGQTRVHLDRVEGLGDFLELEVVLSEQQSPEDGERVARRLMEELEVQEEDLVAGAYLDLLLAGGSPT